MSLLTIAEMFLPTLHSIYPRFRLLEAKLFGAAKNIYINTTIALPTHYSHLVRTRRGYDGEMESGI